MQIVIKLQKQHLVLMSATVHDTTVLVCKLRMRK